jgi:hypothetical protein
MVSHSEGAGNNYVRRCSGREKLEAYVVIA